MTDTGRQDAELERSERDREVAEELVEQAKAEGLDLIGPDGVLTGLTKQVLEAGLEAELSEHLGLPVQGAARKECERPAFG